MTSYRYIDIINAINDYFLRKKPVIYITLFFFFFFPNLNRINIYIKLTKYINT